MKNTYIPFYLGQEVRVDNGEHYVLQPQHFPSNWKDLTRPIYGQLVLRTLYDLTEQECVDVARLAYGEDAKDMEYEKVSDYETDDKKTKVVQFSEGNYILIYLDELMIENRDGLNEDIGYCHYDVHNMALIVSYLTGRGIDLFGLIEAGLAVRKTPKTVTVTEDDE